MRWILEGLLLVVILGLILWSIGKAVSALIHDLRSRRSQVAPWKVSKDDDTANGETLVLLTHPDENPYVIGRVPITLPHWEYDDQLDTLMIEAEAKAASRNRSLS